MSCDCCFNENFKKNHRVQIKKALECNVWLYLVSNFPCINGIWDCTRSVPSITGCCTGSVLSITGFCAASVLSITVYYLGCVPSVTGYFYIWEYINYQKSYVLSTLHCDSTVLAITNSKHVPFWERPNMLYSCKTSVLIWT